VFASPADEADPSSGVVVSRGDGGARRKIPGKSGKFPFSTGEFRPGGYVVFVDGFDDLCSGTKWAKMMLVVEVQAVSVLVRCPQFFEP